MEILLKSGFFEDNEFILALMELKASPGKVWPI